MQVMILLSQVGLGVRGDPFQFALIHLLQVWFVALLFCGGMAWLGWIGWRGSYSLREFGLLVGYWCLWLAAVVLVWL